MGYSISGPGIDEACLDALSTLIKNNISGLATTLARNSLWTGLTSVDSTMVFIGDPDTLPKLALAPLLICVVGGDNTTSGEQTNLDVTGGAGYRYDIEMLIHVYIHPEAFPSASVKTQAENRERAIARACDWLRAGLLNTHANKTLTLTGSTEYGSSADVLNQTHIARINKDYTYKSFGAMTRVRGAEIVWKGWIE